MKLFENGTVEYNFKELVITWLFESLKAPRLVWIVVGVFSGTDRDSKLEIFDCQSNPSTQK